MSDYLCSVPSRVANLKSSTIGDITKVGAFVESQKNTSVGSNCYSEFIAGGGRS